MAIFSGHDLTCRRGDRMVFRGLGFAVNSGQALLLTGANGSGKTSLLRLMAGLGKPVAGQMAWDGVALDDDPDAHAGRVGYLGHQEAVKPHLTVGENLTFWTSLVVGADRAPDAVGDALAAMNIARLADVPGRFLSAGQRRRVNLARIIAARPRLWLLDEPTTALDAATLDGLRVVLTAAQADGAMLVIATHTDMELDDTVALDLTPFTMSGRAEAAA